MFNKFMFDRLDVLKNSAFLAAVLIANKLANFLFVATVLLSIDDSYGLGPTIIQATALSGIFVAFVSPLFYTVLSGGYDHNAKVAIDVTLFLVYTSFCIVLSVSFFFQNSILLLIVLALSLSARGICDSIISVEGLVLHRSLLILCAIEPIRWSIFLNFENTDFFLIIALLSLPVITDGLIRFKSFLNLSKNSIAICISVFGRVIKQPQIKIGYKAIIVCQSEQLFVFFWADTLSGQQSLAYLFAMQMVGLLMLFYLPDWMRLLRRSIELSLPEKTRLIHEHTIFLYKTHFYFLLLIIVFLVSLFSFDFMSNVIELFMMSTSYTSQFKDVTISLVLVLVAALTVFKSVFMDINLLATANFYYRKLVFSHIIFFVGLIVASYDMLSDNVFMILIGVYLCSYIISVLYRCDEVFHR